MELLLTVKKSEFLKMLQLIKGFSFYPTDVSWKPLPKREAVHDGSFPFNDYLLNAHDRDFWWHRFEYVRDMSDTDALAFAASLDKLLLHTSIEGRTIPPLTRFESGAMFNLICEWVQSGEAESFAKRILPFFRGGAFKIRRLGYDLLFSRELKPDEEALIETQSSAQPVE